jgi:hypothetical protein
VVQVYNIYDKAVGSDEVGSDEVGSEVVGNEEVVSNVTL